jgi:hypothetical protein
MNRDDAMTNKSALRRSAEQKKKDIHGLDLADGEPLTNAPADPSTLYSLEELAILLKPLMGIDAPRDSQNRILEVRPKGHWFEYEVVKCLGYHYPPGSGLFPDVRHQLLEVKHHTGKTVTIDFGHHHPDSKVVIDARWNEKAKASIRDIRYLIALAPPPDYKVTILVLATGAEIQKIFRVSPTQTIKYQLGISSKWREQHKGQIIVSGKALDV